MKSRIVHFEIPADDIDRAKRFYGELFGWEFSATPGFEDYWTFATGDPERNEGGGLMSRMSPDQVGLVSYFGVESVADSAAQVEKLGGKVIMARSPVPGMGWFAQCLDPEGNVFALWEPDESAA
jgi:predicted enzyme related to lactoylglutathione lyase